MPRVRLTTLSVLKLSLSLAGHLQWLSGKDSPAIQETQEMLVRSWVGKIPWRRKWQPASFFLPGKSHGQRAQSATVNGVAKELERLSTHSHTHLTWLPPWKDFCQDLWGLLFCCPPCVGCLGAQSLDPLHLLQPLSLYDLISSHSF